MTAHRPPRWLEQCILLSLPDRDREPVLGDLFEAYAEMSARRGRLRADLWYIRQAFSLGSSRLSGAERVLAGLCTFACVYGLWFSTMALVLKHPGYVRLELIAITILGQALLTLSTLALPGARQLRVPVALGCLPLLWLVGMVVCGVAKGAEIEGYVLVMALSLALQAGMTALVLTRRSREAGRPQTH